ALRGELRAHSLRCARAEAHRLELRELGARACTGAGAVGRMPRRRVAVRARLADATIPSTGTTTATVALTLAAAARALARDGHALRAGAAAGKLVRAEVHRQVIRGHVDRDARDVERLVADHR